MPPARRRRLLPAGDLRTSPSAGDERPAFQRSRPGGTMRRAALVRSLAHQRAGAPAGLQASSQGGGMSQAERLRSLQHL